MKRTIRKSISFITCLVLILSLVMSLTGCFFHSGKPGVFEPVEITSDNREALDELENAILQDPAIKKVSFGCHKGDSKATSTELSMDLTLEKSIDKESAEELMKTVILPRLAKNGDILQILLSSGNWHSLRINFVEPSGSMPVCYSSDETSDFQVWKDDGISFDLKDYA